MKRKEPMGVDEALGIEPAEVELEEVHVDSKGTEEDINQDYNIVREKLMTAIVRSGEVIDEAVRSVKSDSSPRTIEAASSIIKTLTENAGKLMDLHDKVRKIQRESREEKEDPKTSIDKNEVRGTMSQALRVVGSRK